MNLDDARILADLWMEHHGLRGWTFELDRASRRFGRCYVFDRRITLSRTLVELNDEREVEDVILHEIAHALAPLGEGHGPAWRKIAASIGARPVRCYSSDRVVTPPGAWIALCPACGRQFRRVRRVWRRDVSCGWCTRVYNARFRLQWYRAPELEARS